MTSSINTKVHSDIGPSSAERWFNCPGSVILSEGMPNPTSFYAAEGSVAHSICELLLTQRIGCCEAAIGSKHGANYVRLTQDRQRMAKTSFYNEMIGSIIHYDGHDVEVDETMLDHCFTYANLVLGDASDVGLDVHKDVQVEATVAVASVHGDIFGTCDAYFTTEKTMHVYDFKYGAGHSVSPSLNKQLMIYGLGALERVDARKIDSVSLVIIQPRTAFNNDGKPDKRWSTTQNRLLEFKAELKEAHTRIKKVTRDNAASHIHTGDWCRYCPGKPVCPAAKEVALNDMREHFKNTEVSSFVHKLTGDEIADTLAKLDYIEHWVSDFRKYAYACAESGIEIPGYKLVDSFGNRKWKDDIDVEIPLSFLDLGVPLHEAPKLRSVAQIETAITKKLTEDYSDLGKKAAAKAKAEAKQALDGLWEKPYKGKNLVLDDSPKEAVKPQRLSADEDFKDVIDVSVVEEIDYENYTF